MGAQVVEVEVVVSLHRSEERLHLELGETRVCEQERTVVTEIAKTSVT